MIKINYFQMYHMELAHVLIILLCDFTIMLVSSVKNFISHTKVTPIIIKKHILIVFEAIRLILTILIICELWMLKLLLHKIYLYG
jgi:hypothetical protein